MMNTTQTTLFSTYSNNGPAAIPWTERVKPGDTIITRKNVRTVVTHVSDNADGAVFVAVAVETGHTMVILQREMLAHFAR